MTAILLSVLCGAPLAQAPSAPPPQAPALFLKSAPACGCPDCPHKNELLVWSRDGRYGFCLCGCGYVVSADGNPARVALPSRRPTYVPPAPPVWYAPPPVYYPAPRPVTMVPISVMPVRGAMFGGGGC